VSETAQAPGEPRQCKYCDAMIFYVVNVRTGRVVPIEAERHMMWISDSEPQRQDQYEPRFRRVAAYRDHWGQCPGAEKARLDAKKRREERAAVEPKRELKSWDETKRELKNETAHDTGDPG